MNGFRKFLALDWHDRLLHIEAWFYLGAARLALLLLPFRRIARHLGGPMVTGEAMSLGAPASPAARRIGDAVAAMAHHTPWQSACLAQAVAGKLMLRRRGLAGRLYLGTKKDETGRLTAHAWLEAGNEILVGGAGHETFTVVGTFGDPPA